MMPPSGSPHRAPGADAVASPERRHLATPGAQAPQVRASIPHFVRLACGFLRPSRENRTESHEVAKGNAGDVAAASRGTSARRGARRAQGSHRAERPAVEPVPGPLVLRRRTDRLVEPDASARSSRAPTTPAGGSRARRRSPRARAAAPGPGPTPRCAGRDVQVLQPDAVRTGPGREGQDQMAHPTTSPRPRDVGERGRRRSPGNRASRSCSSVAPTSCSAFSYSASSRTSSRMTGTSPSVAGRTREEGVEDEAADDIPGNVREPRHNGHMTTSPRRIDTWLTDMDGVLVHEDDPIPGAAEFIEARRRPDAVPRAHQQLDLHAARPARPVAAHRDRRARGGDLDLALATADSSPTSARAARPTSSARPG